MTIKIADYTVSYTEQNHDPEICYTLKEAKAFAKAKFKELGETCYITAYGYEIEQGEDWIEIQDGHGYKYDGKTFQKGW